MDFLEALNEPQREAVTYMNGPMLIIAGPGSGKTRVLTYRIAHLIQQGIDPFNILALTFTNKAAREMRERIESIVGSEARNLFMGTFHSVFARILRVEAPRLGFPSNFTIYDTNDSKNVVKALIKGQGLDEKIYKPNRIFFKISAAKNALISPQDYAQNAEMVSEDVSAGTPKFSLIYNIYVKKCLQNGAMDFDDLLLKFYEILCKFPDALYKYQMKFKHILIDEFQDTNTAQYAIIKKLADMNEQLSVVGDDAQSIYAFRGATITNILNFQKDYPDYHVVKLEQNYRSTPQIVTAANSLIKQNSNQIDKEIWTDKSEGEKIKIFRTISDNEEGKKVADLIFEKKMQDHLSHNDFAILYRTNAQSRAMEEALRRLNIPYKIYGGLSFYQRKEIKDLIGYLKLVVNPREEESLRRVINYPKRGIGNTTIAKIALIANEEEKTMWQIMENIHEQNLPARAKTLIEDFVVMVKSFQLMLQEKNAYDVAFHIAKTTRILGELYADKTIEGISRYENIQELLNGIKEFSVEDVVEEGEEGNEDRSLGAYLQNITLLTDQDKNDEDMESVKMMTVHAAKGLEFPVVFVVGLEENLFPSAMSMYTREDLEEERRLFYVAITRAESHLYISFANTRYKFGSLQFCEPSRFLRELPKETIQFFGQKESKPSSSTSSTPTRKSESGLNLTRKPQKTTLIRKKSTGSMPSMKNFKASDNNLLQEGMEVIHQKFGKGKIKTISGTNITNKMAMISFEAVGERKLMLKFAKLQIV